MLHLGGFLAMEQRIKGIIDSSPFWWMSLTCRGLQKTHSLAERTLVYVFMVHIIKTEMIEDTHQCLEILPVFPSAGSTSKFRGFKLNFVRFVVAI